MELRGLWDHTKLWEQQPLAWCGLGAAGLLLGIVVALVTPIGGGGVGPAANPAVAVTEAPEAGPAVVGSVAPRGQARPMEAGAPVSIDRRRVQPVTAPTSAGPRPSRAATQPRRDDDRGRDQDDQDDSGVRPTVPVDGGDDDGTGDVDPTGGTDPTPDPDQTDCTVVGQAAGALIGAPCP